jgi:hypothetical protein
MDAEAPVGTSQDRQRIQHLTQSKPLEVGRTPFGQLLSGDSLRGPSKPEVLASGSAVLVTYPEGPFC